MACFSAGLYKKEIQAEILISKTVFRAVNKKDVFTDNKTSRKHSYYSVDYSVLVLLFVYSQDKCNTTCSYEQKYV